MKNEEINSWLNSGQDYEKGRALFEKYSKKTPLINLFRRKHKPDVLKYNLEKLLDKPSKQGFVPAARIDPIQAKPIEVAAAPVKLAEGRKQVVVEGKVRKEDLPEELQQVFDQTTELYKHMRAIHEKMKQAVTDDERAKLRAELDDYDDAIAAGWAQIDGWDGTVQEKTVPTQEEKEKQVMAARKFLSVNLKVVKGLEGLKRLQLIFKIQERAKVISLLGGGLSPKLKEELRKLGID